MAGSGVRALATGPHATFDAVGMAGTAVLAHRRLPVVAFGGAAPRPGAPVREFVPRYWRPRTLGELMFNWWD
ncbi:hypothetical protein AB0L75_32135 [Streptomyces sp. NPDC052101]|uniref:hypothetical protein n=1 Tax=Streptomyces sp. NPDC052101 TaxID=3155763 RepID=UPI00342E1DDA